jgi:hypothetical protein
MFTCAGCGDDIETRHLSRTSLNKAGTETRAQALLVLPEVDQVCVWCDEALDDDENEERLEQYTYQGTPLSDLTRAEREWLALNF